MSTAPWARGGLWLLALSACSRSHEWPDTSAFEAQTPSEFRTVPAAARIEVPLFEALSWEFTLPEHLGRELAPWLSFPIDEFGVEDYGADFFLVEGTRIEDLPDQFQAALQDVLQWHRRTSADPRRQLSAEFNAFTPLYSGWGHEALPALFEASVDCPEVIEAFVHLAQVVWVKGSDAMADHFPRRVWQVLEETQALTVAEKRALLDSYLVEPELSLWRSRIAFHDWITFFHDPSEFPHWTEDRIAEVAAEAPRLATILAKPSPHSQEDKTFVQGSVFFLNTGRPVVFLDDEYLPWARQDPKPSLYAARPGITDYWHPFRAKVEEDEQLMTCTGFVGRDEQGNLILSILPKDHWVEMFPVEEPIRVQWKMWQFGREEAFLLWSDWTDGGPVVLSALLAMSTTHIEELPFGLVRKFQVHDLPATAVLEPNGFEWRVIPQGGEFEEVVIFGQGGPWKDRPRDAFRILREREPGSFTLGGVPLIVPYWNVMDRRGFTGESSDQEAESPDQGNLQDQK